MLDYSLSATFPTRRGNNFLKNCCNLTCKLLGLASNCVNYWMKFCHLAIQRVRLDSQKGLVWSWNRRVIATIQIYLAFLSFQQKSAISRVEKLAVKLHFSNPRHIMPEVSKNSSRNPEKLTDWIYQIHFKFYFDKNSHWGWQLLVKTTLLTAV